MQCEVDDLPISILSNFMSSYCYTQISDKIIDRFPEW